MEGIHLPAENPQPHPKIKQVLIFKNNKYNFPISWLNQQGYCEYAIKLEKMDLIEVEDTPEMITGRQIHTNLEKDFLKEAEPVTWDKMLKISKKEEILSRELPVRSIKLGIRGMIDEIWMTPDEFIIIDDKPGQIAFPSSINQVFGYCLAFKYNDFYDNEYLQDGRRIVASLRERGTQNIFWSQYFDEKAENDIKRIINHIHNLLLGTEEFIPTKNPKKCFSCRFRQKCPVKKI